MGRRAGLPRTNNRRAGHQETETSQISTWISQASFEHPRAQRFRLRRGMAHQSPVWGCFPPKDLAKKSIIGNMSGEKKVEQTAASPNITFPRKGASWCMYYVHYMPLVWLWATRTACFALLFFDLKTTCVQTTAQVPRTCAIADATHSWHVAPNSYSPTAWALLYWNAEV